MTKDEIQFAAAQEYAAIYHKWMMGAAKKHYPPEIYRVLTTAKSLDECPEGVQKWVKDNTKVKLEKNDVHVLLLMGREISRMRIVYPEALKPKPRIRPKLLGNN
jgi:hypothetical protein